MGIADPNAGVSDNVIMRDGIVLGSNCNKLLNSRPTALVLRDTNGTVPRIEVMKRGGHLSPSVLDAIGAGPNLVSSHLGGKPRVDIRGHNVNILEHASNTAVAL